jgi:hypothetical protein
MKKFINILFFCWAVLFAVSSYAYSSKFDEARGKTSHSQTHDDETIPEESFIDVWYKNLASPLKSNETHRAITISMAGDSLFIEDGSVWSISDNSKKTALNWKKKDPLSITQNNNWFFSTEYAYKIINLSTKEYIYVDLDIGPYENSKYSHYITSINMQQKEITLENMSIWDISSYDEKALEEWRVLDTIIIGVNSAKTSAKKNILINGNVSNYVRATQK